MKMLAQLADLCLCTLNVNAPVCSCACMSLRPYVLAAICPVPLCPAPFCPVPFCLCSYVVDRYNLGLIKALAK